LYELGASQEQFLQVAEKGLKSEEDKKYFEQLIACDNFVYFKAMMVRRNLQLEEEAWKLMKEKNITEKGDTKELETNLQKIKEDTELECAIQMSLALEEEKKKLLSLEEQELQVKYILYFIGCY
jgi:hypothetical protein